MLTPALNSYSPRFSVLRLPSSSVRSVNQVELSMTPARSSWSAMLPPSSSRTMLTILSAVSGPGLRPSIISQATAPTRQQGADQNEGQESAERRQQRAPRLLRLLLLRRVAFDRRGLWRAAKQARSRPGGLVAVAGGCAHAACRSPACRRLSQSLKSARGLRIAAPCARKRLYMTAQFDETANRPAETRAHAAARNRIEALVPPKPNELDSAT